jgi:uncharacterized protein YfaP (DUF2135 family)
MGRLRNGQIAAFALLRTPSSRWLRLPVWGALPSGRGERQRSDRRHVDIDRERSGSIGSLRRIRRGERERGRRAAGNGRNVEPGRVGGDGELRGCYPLDIRGRNRIGILVADGDVHRRTALYEGERGNW